MFFFGLIQVAKFYLQLVPKIHPLTVSFSVFTYSSDLLLINKYVYGNQQRCPINKARNYDDEVEKAVADSLVSKRKEYWFKDI